MSKGKKRMEQVPVLHPDAAGVDIGADEIFVAVPADRDDKPVRSFPTFTRDLNELVDWLQRCGICTVRNGIHERLLDTAVSDVGGAGY